MQTLWKNKWIDHLLARMNAAYSDGKFQTSQVCFRQQIITCYQFDRRFSHIPNPNRLILFIISIHIQVLILIAIRTVLTRRSEVINDCFLFPYPYQILECDNKRDPCRLNDTDTAPKCTYYHFELANIITMVTSVITWHYALRYFVVKLIRLVRWTLFRDDDQPRKLCCCCRTTPRMLRYIMYFQYISLWLYLLFQIISGFVWNISLFRIAINLLGSTWMPILIAGDRLCTLGSAVCPELLQNWLNATSDGEVLKDFKSKGLLLANVEPLIYLTNNKTKISTSTKTRSPQNDPKIIVQPTTIG
jgi:hypothetical protein